MIRIEKNRITLTKGDTLKVLLHLTDWEGDPYEPAEGDSIRFALQRSQGQTTPDLTVEIPTETMTLVIPAETTKDLLVTDYIYDIEMTFANGDVDTFASGILKVVNEVV